MVQGQARGTLHNILELTQPSTRVALHVTVGGAFADGEAKAVREEAERLRGQVRTRRRAPTKVGTARTA